MTVEGLRNLLSSSKDNQNLPNIPVVITLYQEDKPVHLVVRHVYRTAVCSINIGSILPGNMFCNIIVEKPGHERT